jgi:SAM-dependent methyltransferase
MAERFDAAYYRRHIARLGEGVISLASWWHIPVRSVLDVGAGKGYWREWLAATHPRVKYHGIDTSEYACRRYHHELANIAVWRPRRRYDLVVCQSVIQYLDDGGAAKAIGTLGDACRGLLLFDAPTVADRETVIDPSSTDLDVRWRTGSWYRKRLTVGFTEIGGGLWLSRECHVPFFELELAR